MPDTMDALIKEIAVKHGIALGRDDPILILQTLNARLMEENTRAQQAMLDNYKSELEGLALRWSHETKEKSERILNASLTASKEAMANLLQDSAKATAKAVQKAVDESLSPVSEATRHTERVAMINLIASALTLLAAGAVIFAVFFR